MEFKVVIKCNACYCSFELCGSHISERQNLGCPNCKQPFPQELFDKLKIGITNLYDIPEKVNYENDDIFNTNPTGFKLSIKEWSYITEILKTK